MKTHFTGKSRTILYDGQPVEVREVFQSGAIPTWDGPLDDTGLLRFYEVLPDGTEITDYSRVSLPPSD